MEGATVHSIIYRDSLAEVTLYVSEAAQSLYSAGSVNDTLAKVVELAATTIDGCDFAGICLMDGTAPATAAHTDPIVMQIDALQYRHGEGPCLDALTHRLLFCVDDLSNDLRWPNFAPRATSGGIRSVLALPLSMDSQEGALSLSARGPDAFGVVGRAKATVLASLASLALSLAYSHEDEDRRAAAYRSVTTSR